MLIDFRAQNFRSLRDSATLSFVANADASLRVSHCVATNLNSVPWITRGAAIYGANASGKSNLIFGLGTMTNMVLTSTALTEAQFTELYTPFRLDVETLSEPTEFEVNLLLCGVRYEYGFNYDGDEFVPNGSPSIRPARVSVGLTGHGTRTQAKSSGASSRRISPGRVKHGRRRPDRRRSFSRRRHSSTASC